MITKIIKIKNLGLVFRDYSRPRSLSGFKKANIVYGWNGSGKTTLSRLFEAVGGNTLPGVEYEVEDHNSSKFIQNANFPEKIRVFNQDYVEKNVSIVDSRANTISIVLGEENQELIEQIEEKQKQLNGDPLDPNAPGKLAEHKVQKNSAKKNKDDRDQKFTEIAKTIGAAVGGNALRTYRRQQADGDFKNLQKKSELTQDELAKNLQAVKQESMPVIDEVSLRNILLEDEELVPLDLIPEVISEAGNLLKQTVEANAIKRLTEKPDISSWVEEGMVLHKNHNSKVCEYCSQAIPEARLKELASHFNDADKKLKDDIDTQRKLIAGVTVAVDQLTLPDQSRFYASLHEDYKNELADFEDVKTAIITSLDELSTELENKKSKTTEKLVLKTNIDSKPLTELMNKANELIKTHNTTTKDFDSVKAGAEKKLKEHYLSTIYDAVKTLEQSEKNANQNVETLNSEIKGLQKGIAEAMAQISSDHKACGYINEKLTMFLGHKELQFKPHIEKEVGEDGNETEVSKGYDIMRGDELATKLSEGEKTAIAFVYFVVHLGDSDFKVEDGIVVIDDPISSLDSNSLYQAFSFLKNSVIDAGQCFIFTHNFDFLKLLLNWQKNDNRGANCGFFMIKNNFDEDDNRCATIEPMDKELKDYESEYHYLFKTLKELRDGHDDTIAKSYPIPNIARKVWDTFTMFSVPNGKNQYQKVLALKEAGYDHTELDAIYKFINDQSHITGSGFDPALVPGTKRAVKDMLEIMKTISPDHYRYIDEATNN